MTEDQMAEFVNLPFLRQRHFIEFLAGPSEHPIQFEFGRTQAADVSLAWSGFYLPAVEDSLYEQMSVMAGRRVEYALTGSGVLIFSDWSLELAGLRPGQINGPIPINFITACTGLVAKTLLVDVERKQEDRYPVAFWLPNKEVHSRHIHFLFTAECSKEIWDGYTDMWKHCMKGVELRAERKAVVEKLYNGPIGGQTH